MTHVSPAALPAADTMPQSQDAADQWQHTVARHFQRAASTYAEVSELQRASQRDALVLSQAQGITVELGAGHGELAAELAARSGVSLLIAFDVSEAMLRAAPAAPKLARVVASALAIPLRDHSVDSIVSHFALHWCLSPQAVASELHRVIRRDGLLQLAIPLAGSLAPLHGEAGDGALLLPPAAWQSAFVRPEPVAPRDTKPCARWQLDHSEIKTYTRYFPTATAWLNYLRAMGVTATPQAGTGLAGKQGYRALLQRLQGAQTPAGIPFSFRVWHASLRAR